MKIPLLLTICAAGLSSSCSTIKITNNTDEDLSYVSVVYDYCNSYEITEELNQGHCVKTTKQMLTGTRPVRILGKGEKIYEVETELKPFSNLNVELNSRTVRK